MAQQKESRLHFLSPNSNRCSPSLTLFCALLSASLAISPIEFDLPIDDSCPNRHSPPINNQILLMAMERTFCRTRQPSNSRQTKKKEIRDRKIIIIIKKRFQSQSEIRKRPSGSSDSINNFVTLDVLCLFPQQHPLKSSIIR